MSAKPCNRCGSLIVFGTDQDTGRVLPLMVGARVYRKVKNDVVKLDPEALVPHVCGSSAPAPRQDRSYSEPQGANDE